MAPSAAWLYFTKYTEGNATRAKCKKCSQVFTYCNSTSTLIAHLRKAHKIEVQTNSPKTPARKRMRTDPEGDEDEDDVAVVSAPSSSAELPQASGSRENEGDSLMSPPSSPFPRPTTPRQGQDGATSPSPSRSRSSSPPSRPGSRSGALDKCLQNAAAFSAGGHRDEEVTSALAFMISRDNMPLRTPEKEGFRAFVKKLNPLYKVPGEPRVTKVIEGKYLQLKREVADVLIKEAEWYSVTFDLWTHKSTMRGYLGMTIHIVRGNNLISIELAAHPMPQRKTAANLIVVMEKLCAEWGILVEKVSAVVSDGGANIKAAVREFFGDDKHVPCFAHSLNGVGQAVIELHVKTLLPSEFEADPNVTEPDPDIPDDEDDLDDEGDEDTTDDDEDGAGAAGVALPSALRPLLVKVKKIVRFFKSSEVATNELLTMQADAGIKIPVRLIQEVRTRWNSCFEMLDRFLALSEYVSRVLFKAQIDKSTKSKPPAMVTAQELEALTEVKSLLKPLAIVTAEVSVEKTVSISKIIPLVNFIKKRATEFQPITLVGKRVKRNLLDEMANKFDTIEKNPLYAIATLLDPRFKKVPFQSPAAIKAAEREIGRLVTQTISESRATDRAAYQAATALEDEDAQDSGQRQQVDPDDPWGALDRDVRTSNEKADTDRVGGQPVELRQYLNRPPIDRKSNPNPLQSWQSLKTEYPHLYKIALKVFSIVATSVPCERLFSHAGLIANQLRCQLSGPHLDMLVFLRNVTFEEWSLGFAKVHANTKT